MAANERSTEAANPATRDLDLLPVLEQARLMNAELKALAQAGLMPRFDSCAICGGRLGELPRFDPEHGGTVCRGCEERAQWAITLPSQLLDCLSALQSGAPATMLPATRRRAREVLNLFISHHLGRRLKSVDFMNQVGLD